MKKSFIIIMSITLIMTLFQLTNYTLIEAKIIYEFSDENRDLSTDEVKNYISGSGKVNIVTRFQYNPFKVENTLPDDATMEEVDAYKARVFALGKKYHKTLNEKYASTLDILNYDSCYISEYTPYCEYTFDESYFKNNIDDILSKLSSNKNVKQIFVKNSNSLLTDQIEVAKMMSSSYDLIESGDLSGNGVKIGMLETGYPDFNHVNLDSITHMVNVQNSSVTEHATKMANIICGEYGIARGAKLYCSGIKGNDIVYEIDWLINRGVDVVNMSFGEGNATATYNSDSALTDYMVITYNIIVCAAVGNQGTTDGKVANPGLAYNVISVGCSTDGGNRASYSSYDEGTYAQKPTIVAPADGISIPNVNESVNGTSAACALTTGLVALLLNAYPVLKTKAMQVVAMVVSTSDLNSFYDYYCANGFEEYIGAGILNFQRLYDNYYKIYTINNTSTLTGRVVYEWDVVIAANKTIRACFAWGAHPDIEDYTRPVFTDYDVRITDEYGNILAEANSSADNVEVATYKTLTSGKYYLQLYQYGPYPSGYPGDTIYFSYRYR